MFVIRTIHKNIIRHLKKSILSILITILIVFFLFLYFQNIKENETQLINLRDTLPVTARICNLDGSQEVGLQIDFEKIQQIHESGMVTDEVTTTQAYANLTDTNVSSRRPEFSFIGTNDISAFSAFSPHDITYIENYNDTFLSGEEAVCIVRDKFLKEHKLNLKDEFGINVYAPKYDAKGWQTFTYQKLGIVKLKVIGSYNSNDRDLSDELPDIISPIGFIVSIYEGGHTKCYASSGSFTLNDPLKLNQFKRNMKEIGFLSVDMQAGFSRVGEALIINDETFILSATQLTESLILLKSLAPLIFIIVAMIGFITSYLLMQSRQNEFAIMRSLGTSKKKCFQIIFLESILLVLLGSLLGVVGAAFITNINHMTMGLVSAIFVLFYMLGTVIALLLLNRFSVMAILSKND